MGDLKRTNDTELIFAHDRLMFPDSSRVTEEPGNAYWIVTDDDGEVVAYASVRALRVESGDPEWSATAFLSRAGVHPSARRKGLQKRLIRARVSWARRNGFKRVVTYTAWGNVPSLRALVRCGFLPYLPSYHWAGDIVYLERHIGTAGASG